MASNPRKLQDARAELLAGVLNTCVEADMGVIPVKDLYDLFNDECGTNEYAFRWPAAFRDFVERYVPVSVREFQGKKRAIVVLDLSVSKFIFDRLGVDAKVDLEVVSEVNAAWSGDFKPQGDVIFTPAHNRADTGVL